MEFERWNEFERWESSPLAARRRRRLDAVKLMTGIGVLFVVGNGIRQAASDEQHARLYSVDEDTAWVAFKAKYNKAYSGSEEAQRRQAYHTRMGELAALNGRNGDPAFGETVHADRLEPTYYGRGRRHTGVPVDVEVAVATSATADVVDWRAVDDVLTPVKNQGQCGSCWAFSVTEQIESQLVLQGVPSVELSAQQLASCTPRTFGCGGGDTTAAYDYVKDARGLAPAAYWPYTQGLTPDDACDGPGCTAACDKSLADLDRDYQYIGPYASVHGFSFAVEPCRDDTCDHQDLDGLMAVVETTPVSVCVNAARWDDYVGGVLSADACGGFGMDDLDHCVQLVGFNVDEGYWIVRNSWSVDWGIDGFIYLDLHNNTCGLADEATLADVSVGVPTDPSSVRTNTSLPRDK